jgi:hypothetical protein
MIDSNDCKVKKVKLSKSLSPKTVLKPAEALLQPTKDGEVVNNKEGFVSMSNPLSSNNSEQELTQSLLTPTNGVEIKKVKRKKKVDIAPNASQMSKPRVSSELTTELLQVLSNVPKSQRSQGEQQGKRKQKPVTRKNVSKLVKKSIQFQRTGSKANHKKASSNSLTGKVEKIGSFSTLKNPMDHKPVLKKEGGQPKSKMSHSRESNKGKGLVVKLAALGVFKRKPLLTPDKSSVSSRNSSTVTSDSEGMLYSLADVSSLSSNSDSDDDGPTGD